MAYENIILEKEENIAIITFNRPEAMNALNNQTRAEFRQAIGDVAADEKIKVLILTGNGKAFVAGSDIKEGGHVSVTKEIEWILHLTNHSFYFLAGQLRRRPFAARCGD